MTLPKASAAAVKRIPGWYGGWATFKLRLMDVLGVPREQFTTWNVPQDWQDAFKKACGR